MEEEAREILANAVVPSRLSERRLKEIRAQIAALREPGAASLADELIVERRAEAARE